MKAKPYFRSGLLLLLCALLVSACTTPTPAPEESDLPAEESSESLSPIPEDPNAKIVRAYLEELLEAGWSSEWLTADRAEAIRESVKALKSPILTEEDVLRIAEKAAAFYLAAWQGKQEILLPACGVLGLVRRVPERFSFYSEHEGAYNALLAYTLYLFTPSNYIFWGSEIWGDGGFIVNDTGLDPAYSLCFPFAGDYTSRSGALNAIREKRRCVRLYPSVSDGERPLDFSYCGTADRLQGGECELLALDLILGEVAPFRAMCALEFLRPRLEHCLHPGIESPYMLLYDGSIQDSLVCIPFYWEEVRTTREMAELLPSPLLTEQDVRGLLETFNEEAFADWGANDKTFLLPMMRGEEDLRLGPYELPRSWRMRLVLLHLIDLFTPPDCRYTDLFDQPGDYYALDGDGASHVLVTGACELYLVDETGFPEPLLLKSPEEGMLE